MKNFDLPPRGAEELRALLERSGVDFRREGDRFWFLFTSRGCKWQTVCDCRGDLVLIYGVHPARVTRPEQALELCSELNSRLIQGSFFLREERLIFRTSAKLTERFDAQERIAVALEYNAAVLSSCWEQLSVGVRGPTEFPLNPGAAQGSV